MERKGYKRSRGQRRSRSWILSPVIMVQIAAIMLLAGVGAAFALTDNTFTQVQEPWAGHASVSDGPLGVLDYELDFDAALTHVTGIILTLSNADTGAGHTGNVEVALGGSSGDLVITPEIPASGTRADVTVTLDTAVDIASVGDTLRIIVTTN